MLDPEWTLEAAYSHADALLAIIRRQEQVNDHREGEDDEQAVRP